MECTILCIEVLVQSARYICKENLGIMAKIKQNKTKQYLQALKIIPSSKISTSPHEIRKSWLRAKIGTSRQACTMTEISILRLPYYFMASLDLVMTSTRTNHLNYTLSSLSPFMMPALPAGPSSVTREMKILWEKDISDVTNAASFKAISIADSIQNYQQISVSSKDKRIFTSMGSHDT